MREYTEKILVEIIKTQHAHITGGKIPDRTENISSMKVETILNAVGDLFSSDDLANLLCVDREAIRKSYNKAVKRMRFFKKYYWLILIGILFFLSGFLSGLMWLSHHGCNILGLI